MIVHGPDIGRALQCINPLKLLLIAEEELDPSNPIIGRMSVIPPSMGDGYERALAPESPKGAIFGADCDRPTPLAGLGLSQVAEAFESCPADPAPMDAQKRSVDENADSSPKWEQYVSGVPLPKAK
jgi:hypothetical protein